MPTKPPGSDVKKELENLWKSTVDQFDELTDALVKTSQAGKAKLDATMLRRERDQVLSRLGALVAADAGHENFPEAWRHLITEASALSARIDEEDKRFGRVFGTEGPAPAKAADKSVTKPPRDDSDENDD